MTMRALMIGLLSLFAATAQGQTVQEMLSHCRPIASATVGKEPKTVAFVPTFETGQCWGAFAVLQDVSRWINDPKRPNETRLLGFCPPSISNRSQYVGIFVRFADQNPARWHEDFLPVAVDALRSAFPCR
jgi:hypothetical protein